MTRSILIASTFFGLVLGHMEQLLPSREIHSQRSSKSWKGCSEPAEAAPGQSVILKVELKLGDGWITWSNPSTGRI